METDAHIALKAASRAFLIQRGARAVATEVRCPLARRRIDAAGYFPRSPRHTEAQSAQVGLFTAAEAGLSPADARREGAEAGPGASPGVSPGVSPWTKEQRRARTVILECKATRADFLRDNEQRAALTDHARRLRARVEKVERSLRARAAPGAEPRERLLFAELEEWDFNACVSPARQEVMGQLAAVERKLRAETKFEEMARYRLADCLLIAAPAGEIKPRDLPQGWGLAECPRAALHAWTSRAQRDAHAPPPELTIRVRPPALDATPLWRERLLRHIAYALTK